MPVPRAYPLFSPPGLELRPFLPKNTTPFWHLPSAQLDSLNPTMTLALA